MASDPHRKFDFDRTFRLLLTAGGVVALFLLLRYLADVLIPFALAVLLAYLLNPVVVALDSRIKRRAISVLITVFGCGLVLLAVLAVMIPVVHAQVEDVGEIIGQMRGEQKFLDRMQNASETWTQQYQAFRNAQSARVQMILSSVEQVLTDLDLEALTLATARKLAPGVWGVLTGAVSMLLGLMGLIIVLLYLVFLLIDYPRYSTQWKELLPPTYRAPLVQFLGEFTTAMSRYFRGQALIAASVGVLFAVGFTVIGLRMSVVFGLCVGVLNMVPYLQSVALVPALLLAVLRAVERGGGLLTSVLLVLLVFAVVQTIQDTLLTPRILGKTTGLRPVAILLGLFIWGKLLGFLGLLLAIPLTCLGIAYYQRFVLDRGQHPPAPDEAGV